VQDAAIRAFFDELTNTVSYLVWDPATTQGAVIDPVLDWDNRSGKADTHSAEALLTAAEANGMRYLKIPVKAKSAPLPG